ncbi:hypothetical protein vBBceSLY1_00010 [Bacillus phage vB_BceS_LY1]|uniref:Uncharacterized protein n=1 Tax=Bacillus phage vB_BceS_LY1 TaxID=2950459 RepID=A0A9Y1CV96_9CAUD|nr:hypothetical protein vBBceSLY1_00010 [Bacillus phage vB_BceS_LY1]
MVTIYILENGTYYPVEVEVINKTEYSIKFKTKRGKIRTEPLTKVKFERGV